MDGWIQINALEIFGIQCIPMDVVEMASLKIENGFRVASIVLVGITV